MGKGVRQGALVAMTALAGCDGNAVRVTAIDPPFGNVSGNEDVIITGNGFGPGMTVQFGRRQVRRVVLDSSRRIRVKTPTGPPGAVDVVVTTEDGRAIVVRAGFRFRREQ